MNARPPKTWVSILGIAMLALLVAAAGAQAAWSPFDSYYDNVARAAAANNAALVQQLVGTGNNPNQPDQDEHTGLHIAAMSGNLQIVAILIKAGAKLDIKDKNGDTPLHLAAARGQVEVAKLLLEAGAAIDPQNKNGVTPLMIAASHGNVDIVRALLSLGANTAKLDYTGRDAASWAADSRRPAVVQMIKRAANDKRS